MAKIVGWVPDRDMYMGQLQPWWRGVAWRDYSLRVSLVCPIPLNKLLAWLRAAWCWLGLPTQTLSDAEMEKRFREAEAAGAETGRMIGAFAGDAEGYRRGLAEGYQKGVQGMGDGMKEILTRIYPDEPAP